MKYPWQAAYEKAIFETDPAKRPAQIASAETIMYRRQTSLFGNPNAFEERKMLQLAIAKLRNHLAVNPNIEPTSSGNRPT